MQISKEEWDGLMNGTDRATPAYIGVDAALILGSSEGIWLGDLWQEIQEWGKAWEWEESDILYEGLLKIGKNLFDATWELPDVDVDKDNTIHPLLCDFRKAIISKFYEIEVDAE